MERRIKFFLKTIRNNLTIVRNNIKIVTEGTGGSPPMEVMK